MRFHCCFESECNWVLWSSQHQKDTTSGQLRMLQFNSGIPVWLNVFLKRIIGKNLVLLGRIKLFLFLIFKEFDAAFLTGCTKILVFGYCLKMFHKTRSDKTSLTSWPLQSGIHSRTPRWTVEASRNTINDHDEQRILSPSSMALQYSNTSPLHM